MNLKHSLMSLKMTKRIQWMARTSFIILWRKEMKLRELKMKQMQFSRLMMDALMMILRASK
jgi:hypothetical protein